VYVSNGSAPGIGACRTAGRPVAYDLLVGFTRLGDLHGLINRGEVGPLKRHLVWIGD
jgi:hypothetical protein